MQNILLLLGCGYNCHRKCMEKVPNTCGINQKLMKEIGEIDLSKKNNAF